jgi:hypothetical protein
VCVLSFGGRGSERRGQDAASRSGYRRRRRRRCHRPAGWLQFAIRSVGMALVLGLMAETGRKLSELVSELPSYTIVKDKYTIDSTRLPSLFDGLTRHWPDAKKDDTDGLRLEWADRWVHVRPSDAGADHPSKSRRHRRKQRPERCVRIGGKIVEIRGSTHRTMNIEPILCSRGREDEEPTRRSFKENPMKQLIW